LKEIGPLPPGETRDKVEKLCQEVGYPLTRIFVVDGNGYNGKAKNTQNA
jgi:hypothetical protein